MGWKKISKKVVLKGIALVDISVANPRDRIQSTRFIVGSLHMNNAGAKAEHNLGEAREASVKGLREQSAAFDTILNSGFVKNSGAPLFVVGDTNSRLVQVSAVHKDPQVFHDSLNAKKLIFRAHAKKHQVDDIGEPLFQPWKMADLCDLGCPTQKMYFGDSNRYHKYRLEQKGWIWTEGDVTKVGPTFKVNPKTGKCDRSRYPNPVARVFALSKAAMKGWECTQYACLRGVRKSDHLPVESTWEYSWP